MDPYDPAHVVLRARPKDHRPRPRSTSWGAWIVVAVVCAIAFVFTVRALLARTAWTAGSSSSAVTEPAARASVAPGAASPAQHEYLPAPVPMVYRCVDGAGGVSLQSQPCGPGQRTTRAIPAPPDIEPPRPLLQRSVSATTRTHGVTSAPIHIDTQRTAARARCASARAQREATLQQVGLRRTFDLLRRLDDMVAQACRDA